MDQTRNLVAQAARLNPLLTINSGGKQNVKLNRGHDSLV